MKFIVSVLLLVLGFVLAGESYGQQVLGDVALRHSESLMLTEQARRYVVIQRPDGPPVIVGGAEDSFARNDLVGLWRVTHVESKGTPNPALASALQMRFHRGKLELMQEGRPTITVAYGLDTHFYPYHFNWRIWSNGRICLQRGCYWLTEKELLICLGPVNGRRANSFLTEPDDGRTLFVLEPVE